MRRIAYQTQALLPSPIIPEEKDNCGSPKTRIYIIFDKISRKINNYALNQRKHINQ